MDFRDWGLRFWARDFGVRVGCVGFQVDLLVLVGLWGFGPCSRSESGPLGDGRVTFKFW